MVAPKFRSSSLPLLALLALAGCKEAPPPQPAAAGERYTVRGELVRISAPGRPPEVSIRHEAVPDFRDRSGAVVGMMPMVMPFPVAKGVSLDGYAPGDKVRFRFRMDFEAGRAEIESLERLPADTQLDFAFGAR